jgi:glycosyltransferase involved in cell wall biosynthesis
LKIAMIGQKRVPSREGGVEIHVEEISSRLAAQGHSVTVYNRKRKPSKVEKQKQYRGIYLIDVPTINVKSLDAVIYSFFATVRALLGHYDVIHYHAEGPCAMLVLPHIFGIKTVATIHGLDWQRAKWGGFAKMFLLHGEKTAAKYADEIIVLSKNVQKYFRDTYGRETHYIPNGINKPVVRDADLIFKKYGLQKNGYILFLARIVPEKGLHYLLEAFSKIDTDKKLVIAGASSHTNEYVDKIKKIAENDKRIIMTGFVQGAELDELYSNAYLYVLPSDIEGMPISLLEAMSYGCPCLVSDIAENMEVIKNHGFSFHKGDTNDLKAKLINLLGNQSLKEVGEQACRYVLDKYSWDGIVEKIAQCYEAALRDKEV